MELHDGVLALDHIADNCAQPDRLLTVVALVLEGTVKRAIKTGPTRAFKTGNMMRSVHADVSGPTKKVGVNADYAPHIYFGTKKMKPRPFLEAGIALAQKEIERIWPVQAQFILQPLEFK